MPRSLGTQLEAKVARQFGNNSQLVGQGRRKIA